MPTAALLIVKPEAKITIKQGIKKGIKLTIKLDTNDSNITVIIKNIIIKTIILNHLLLLLQTKYHQSLLLI